MTKDCIGIEPGVLPAKDDPEYEAVNRRMALTRHGLGVGIYLSNAYPTLKPPVNFLCGNGNMQSPSEDTLKHLKFAVMHLLANPEGSCWTHTWCTAR